MVFLEEPIKRQIEENASKEGSSVSKYAADLIKLGLKIKGMKQDESRQKEEELERNHTEYLLRILGIVSDLYSSQYDSNKMGYKCANADEALSRIKDKVQSYIDGYLGKDEVNIG